MNEHFRAIHFFSRSHLAKRSMSSILDKPSGRIRGMAATQVRKRSIFGFLSPLTQEKERNKDTVKYEETRKNRVSENANLSEQGVWAIRDSCGVWL